jgi:hypothetical protein
LRDDKGRDWRWKNYKGGLEREEWERKGVKRLSMF